MSSMEMLAIFFIYLHALFTCTQSTNTISINQTIRDGQTIVSAHESFELGFFSPDNTSPNRYLGIWYKRLAQNTVIWVANRETPIGNKSGKLTLNPGGLLVLRDSTNNRIIWSSNSLRNSTGNMVAKLLDDSNFMVVDSEDGAENYIWQSFDHPSGTIMPKMKFGRNLERGVVTNYTSWKSDDDPSLGQYMIYMNFSGLPQIYQKKGDVIQYRLGSWNGFAYSGSTINNGLNPTFHHSYYSDEVEISAVYVLTNESVLTRLTISPEGNMEQWICRNRTEGWFMYGSLTTDSCERYALCGVHAICDIMRSPNCVCLQGFTPKRPDQWDTADWGSGCQREIPLDCDAGEGFRKYSFIKIPDTGESWFNKNMTLAQCNVKCTSECNCTAYGTLDIKQGTGCVLWYNELIDMRKLPKNGQDIYIRVSAIELGKDANGYGSKEKSWAIIIPLSLGLLTLLGLCMLIIMKKVKAQALNYDLLVKKDGLDLPFFRLSTLRVATDNFSAENKLGEGGFGPVYKGFMFDGREIAVKRLSVGSTQGVKEFKNEVIFISKLQHRNLVQILGCCIEGGEKLLVYEYMPNSSLDLLLFDETKSKTLDWSQRFRIIAGIARGLLYLHQDSQLQIIHRDLKAANILLDEDMNPKISDFGIARSFVGNETGTNTNRAVGTYGYMSPEYASDGIFSVKSDVFSFGVLTLEIISGTRTRGSFDKNPNHNLLGHAWTLYDDGNTLGLVDPSLNKSGHTSELLRAIQVGLLCVQHNPQDRPNMSVVVTMLSGEGQLPEPKKPAFFHTVKDRKFGP